MFLDDVIAIHSRLTNVPKELRATAHTAGTPAVLIACKTAREAELVAFFIRHAHSDICLLLTELGERREAEQLAMELNGKLPTPKGCGLYSGATSPVHRLASE